MFYCQSGPDWIIIIIACRPTRLVGEGLAPEAVKELHRATDLVLYATKQMGHAIGCSMDPMVNGERHLWLNLMERDKALLLDGPISPSGLFVNTINDRFQEAKKQSATFSELIPRCVRRPESSTSHSRPGPSYMREEQKSSMVASSSQR